MQKGETLLILSCARSSYRIVPLGNEFHCYSLATIWLLCATSLAEPAKNSRPRIIIAKTLPLIGTSMLVKLLSFRINGRAHISAFMPTIIANVVPTYDVRACERRLQTQHISRVFLHFCIVACVYASETFVDFGGVRQRRWWWWWRTVVCSAHIITYHTHLSIIIKRRQCNTNK